MTKFQSNGLVVMSARTGCVPETVRFYRDVVGLSNLVHHGHQPAFELGNGAFLILVETNTEMAQPALNPRFPLPAFDVGDLEQAVARLRVHNVEMPWGIESNPQHRWVELYDPGGNLIEFAQLENSEAHDGR